MNYLTQNQIEDQLTQIFIKTFNDKSVYIKSIRNYEYPGYNICFSKHNKYNHANKLFNKTMIYVLYVPTMDFKCFTQNDLNTYITYTFVPYCNQAKRDYDKGIAMFLY